MDAQVFQSGVSAGCLEGMFEIYDFPASAIKHVRTAVNLLYAPKNPFRGAETGI